ncbi:MAG TPA: hypothetical protein ACFYED_08955 [Candidatus Tripitaka californicus]|uniref:hypothetical protein n=1 Tax=Candidatus Tripitaka californicus TaxID=3367616 RepID=UPI004024F9F4|nr:hypothetical protein [Planctomycetota bacterium]
MQKNIPDPILKELSETIKEELGEHIKDIILFGSRANVILSKAKNLIYKLDPSLRSG